MKIIKLEKCKVSGYSLTILLNCDSLDYMGFDDTKLLIVAKFKNCGETFYYNYDKEELYKEEKGICLNVLSQS